MRKKVKMILIITVVLLLSVGVISVVAFMYINKTVKESENLESFLQEKNSTESNEKFDLSDAKEYMVVDTESAEYLEEVYQEDATHEFIEGVEIITPYEFKQLDYNIDNYGKFLIKSVLSHNSAVTYLKVIEETNTTVTFKGSDYKAYVFDYGVNPPTVSVDSTIYTWKQ